MHRLTTSTALVSLGLLALSGCQEEEKKSQADSPAAASASASAASTAAVLNPEIAKAVAAAAKKDGTADEAGDGPPPNGLLSPERANKEATVAAGTQVTLGSAGTDPKVKLGGPEVTEPRIGQMELSLMLGPRSGLPTTAMRFEADGQRQNKDDPASPVDVTIELKDVGLAQNQPGQIPPELGDAIAKLKGSKLSYTSVAGKPKTSPSFEIAKGATKDLDLLLMSAADVLSSAILAFPDEPVGKDGFWMTTSREKYANTDVVAYRMIKVVEVTDKLVRLDVQTRRYAAAESMGMPDMGQHTLERFQVNETANVAVVPGHRLPVEGRVESTLMALAATAEGTGQRQMRTRALVAFPPKLDEPAKAPAK